jgi:hypothetical protein
VPCSAGLVGAPLTVRPSRRRSAARLNSSVRRVRASGSWGAASVGITRNHFRTALRSAPGARSWFAGRHGRLRLRCLLADTPGLTQAFLRSLRSLHVRRARPGRPGFGGIRACPAAHFRRMIAPNSSFNPNPLRSTNNMAGRACHVVGSTTRVGLTQALGA